MSQRGRPGPRDIRNNTGSFEGGANPFYYPDGADDTAEILHLRLQGQVLLGRALEMENSLFRDEVNRLREQVHFRGPPVGTLTSRTSFGRRPLAERIDWAERQAPPPYTFGGRERGPRVDPLLPPTVTIRPVDIHPRFLPLGNNFQEGGTGGPMFSRPEDWPDAIHQNPSARPRGVRRWGSHVVNLDDLHVHVQIGRMVYGGNRPPGRRDPVDSQRPWRAIEAAFFRATIMIVLQPDIFVELRDQLTPSQRTPIRQPFLANVDDPNQLELRDVVQHLTRSGITESWIRGDIVVEYAKAYLRDWARHQTDVASITSMGQLFRDLYPDGITNPNDPHHIEDAAAGQEMSFERIVEVPMEEEVDEVPPLEPNTPSTMSPPRGPSRAQTPLDERLDWGEDEM